MALFRIFKALCYVFRSFEPASYSFVTAIRLALYIVINLVVYVYFYFLYVFSAIFTRQEPPLCTRFLTVQLDAAE